MNDFLLFMGTIILMPIILMGAYHCKLIVFGNKPHHWCCIRLLKAKATWFNWFSAVNPGLMFFAYRLQERHQQ
jgi:hypothetical protein